MGACDITGLQDTADDLLDPDPVTFEAPGTQIAAGQFRDLRWGATLTQEPRLFALDVSSSDGDEETPRFAVFSHREEGRCDAGPATDYRLFFHQERPGLVAALHDPDGDDRGEVRFTDFDCNPVLSAREDVVINEHLLDSTNGGFLLEGSGDLYWIDAEPASQEKVASGVDYFQVYFP